MNHLTVLLGILNELKNGKAAGFKNYPVFQFFINSVEDTKLSAFSEIIFFEHIEHSAITSFLFSHPLPCHEICLLLSLLLTLLSINPMVTSRSSFYLTFQQFFPLLATLSLIQSFPWVSVIHNPL